MWIAAGVSLGIHGSLIAGGVVYAALVGRQFVSAGPVVAQTLPEDRLGTPGLGEGFLAKDGQEDEKAALEGRPQPNLLDAPTAKPAPPSPTDPAEALREAETPAPLAEPLLPDAAGLAGPPPAEAETSEPADEPAEPAQPASPPVTAPPAPKGSDRESPAVSRTKVPIIDIQTGRVLSGGDLDFKPRLLRAGLGAYVSGVRGRTLRVRLAIDRTGTPIEVAIVRSTGSPSVDELVERSLFEWWFNPQQQSPNVSFEFELRL